MVLVFVLLFAELTVVFVSVILPSMKVKIGNRIFDGTDQPVMVILSPRDKENIAGMAPDQSKYCVAPDGYDPARLLAWMRAGDCSPGISK